MSAASADMVCGRPFRPSLQSDPEPPALDRPPVSKHDTKLLCKFLTSDDLDL